MEQEFLINVLTKQEIEGEKDQLEIMTKATLSGEKDDYIISYTEQEEDNSESKTTLHVEGGRCITITRDSAINTHMIVEKDVRHISHHVTPYGAFSMGVSALDIESDIDKNGGRLKFSYVTDIEMSPVGKIEFDITLSLTGV